MEFFQAVGLVSNTRWLDEACPKLKGLNSLEKGVIANYRYYSYLTTCPVVFTNCAIQAIPFGDSYRNRTGQESCTDDVYNIEVMKNEIM